jgi:hypothetical protein
MSLLYTPRKIKTTNVIAAVSKLVNFVRSKGLNHQQFKDFLSDMESKYGDALLYTKVRWLRLGRMLKHVCELKPETEVFLEMKRKPSV